MTQSITHKKFHQNRCWASESTGWTDGKAVDETAGNSCELMSLPPTAPAGVVTSALVYETAGNSCKSMSLVPAAPAGVATSPLVDSAGGESVETCVSMEATNGIASGGALPMKLVLNAMLSINLYRLCACKLSILLFSQI